MKTAARAKLFRNGGSQAVRLPKGCKFPDGLTEVLVRKEGRRVIIEAPDEWSEEFIACLGCWPEGIERLPQTPIQDLKIRF